MVENGNNKEKLKVGLYWASSCGGCDISFLEIGPHILELIEVADIIFWPCATDFKYADLAAYPDNHIDIMLWNGGVRSSEQEELALLIRKKSKILVAYGACAIDGGIPALANLSALDDIMETAYLKNPSIDNAAKIMPGVKTETEYGELELPRLYPQVLRLSDIVKVDYLIPGCPPQANQVWEALQQLIAGNVKAGNGGMTRVGCGDKSVCEECPYEKRKIRIKEIKRPHQAVPEPGWCLLEQGFICLGPATRSGCGAPCLKAHLPCRGCYGPSGENEDQGTAMISALGSLLDSVTEEHTQEMLEGIFDPVGTFYRFSLSSSEMKGRR